MTRPKLNGRLTRPTGPAAPGSIAFRLDEHNRCVLAERAAALGVSPHELARHYVLEVLQEPEEREALRQAVAALHRGLAAVRDDVIASVEVLLSSAGKVTEEDARAWVDENFK